MRLQDQIFLLALALASCSTLPPYHAEGRSGVVVTSSLPGSGAGLSILRQGGNAVDATIATAFALAVTYPSSGNLGGGGFMLVHPAPGGGAPAVIDYRETAPAAASKTMYTREESQFTHRAVAVPGTVRGLALAHRKFGSLPWSELLVPAIQLAREGFAVSEDLATMMNEVLASAREFEEFQRVYGKPGGRPWMAGDRLVQPDLARTLELLRDEGPDAFYTGPIAREITAEIARGKGFITAADLAGYQAIERRPLHARYRGLYDVYVPPPPSAGGICLIEELGVAECFDLASWGRWSPKTLHVLVEAMRRACRDRAVHLGDPAFVDIPPQLATAEYAHRLAGGIDLARATRSDALSGDIRFSEEGHDTTQISVIDGRGMAVANTYTLERLWGSRIVVKNMGFLLNNDMRAFNLFPGLTDKKGAIGTEPNTIAPGKRPISSMAPTIVARDGRALLVTGTPGSRSIPATILCVLVNILDFGMPLLQAVDEPRISHEWFPDEIRFEKMELYPEAVEGLKNLGHRVVPLPDYKVGGCAHTILARGIFEGVADRRRGGSALGY